MISNYEVFRNHIKNLFGISNEESHAIRVIQSLKQIKSTSEYAAKFQEYAQIID